MPKTKVKSESVSTKTRPRSMAARMFPAAPGLRAMPSHAAEAIRPWPSAPPNAAMARPKPTAKASVVVFTGAFSAAPPWANADGAIARMAIRATTSTAVFFITSSLSSQGLQVQILKPDEIAARRWFPDTVQPGSHWTATKNFPATLVLFRRGHTDIDRRQNGEDIRLNNGNKDVQADESQRQDGGKHAQDDSQHGSLGPTPKGRSGEQAEKDAVNHIAGENVGPKTNGEREQSRRGADDFHGENQRREPPDRSGKVLEVSADAMVADALPATIEKSKEGASQGNVYITSRRGKERKSSEEVAEKHENRNRADKGNVLRSVMSGVFFKQIANSDAERIGEKHLGDLLAGTGLFNRQSGTEKECYERSDHQDDQTHHDVLGNRQLGIVGRDVQRVKQGQDQRPQKMIDQLGYAEYVFFHSLFHGMQDFPHTCRDRRDR